MNQSNKPITAVYLYPPISGTKTHLSDSCKALIREATKDSVVTSRDVLPMTDVRYQIKPNKETPRETIWTPARSTRYKVTNIEPEPLWRKGHPLREEASLVDALAGGSDRMLFVVEKPSTEALLLLFLARLKNRTVKLFVGSEAKPVDVDTLLQNSQASLKPAYTGLLQPPETAKETVQEPTHCLKTPSGATLRPYQQQLVDFCKSHPYCGLFVDMGLGKTLATLALLSEWEKDGTLDKTKPVLIVAPIVVALDTWGREVAKWGYDFDTVINIQKTPRQRELLLTEMLRPRKKVTLFLTNPAQLEPIRSFYASRRIPLPFEILIVDELSQFKAPVSKRNDDIRPFREVAKRFVGLTGTPSPNQLLDIWNQIKLIDKEGTPWAKKNIYAFQDAYFVPASYAINGRVRKWRPKAGTEDMIYQNLKHHAISMRTKGLVDLPKISFVNQYITLPKDARDVYEKAEEEISEMGDGSFQVTEEGRSVYVPNTDVLKAKLMQLANGTVYTDSKTHTYEVVHTEKLKALESLLETMTSPLLVFYYFQSDLKEIQKKFKNRLPVLDPHDPALKQTIKRWNDGELPVVLAHPASVGHGLNLQDGGHTICWYTLPNWNNDQYQQANKRLHRSGQKEPVTVLHLLVKDTIESIMLRSIQNKQRGNDRLMKALSKEASCDQ